MLEQKAQLQERDLGKQPLSEEELDRLIGSRPYLEFLNTKNELYRSMKMKEKPPSRQEALRLMAKEPNLIRRPIVIRGKRLVIGFDADRLMSLVQ